jgi:hypothetical protein
VKRREGIGGVTIAVVGLVLALSVGIAATAHGGVFDEALTESSPEPARAVAPEPGTAVTAAGREDAPAQTAGVRKTGTSTRTTTTVSVQTVAPDSAGSATGRSGTCIVKARIVTSAPAASDAHAQPRAAVGRPRIAHGGHARRDIPA